MGEAALIVDRQIAAYERGDLQGFLDAYAEDAVCAELPSGRILAAGHEQIAAIWGPLFERGPRKVVLRQRIALGRSVTDHEIVTEVASGRVVSAVAIYWVGDTSIERAWYLDGAVD